MGYSPQGRKESDTTEQLHSHRFAIAFHSKSKLLLISWLQLPSAVILEPTEKKSVTVSNVFPSICHEEMGPDGEGNGNPVQYSCLENPMDRRAC